MDTLNNLLSRKQLSEKIGVHIMTIDKWVKAGKLPVHKIGKGTVRFKEDEVAEALFNNTSKSLVNA